MLDMVDKVIKAHIQKLLTVRGKPIPVFSVGTADQDDQAFSQAGIAKEKKPDRVDLPFLSLIRLPDIQITDYNVTKRVHNYSGYEADEIDGVQITYDRCTLSYVATVFAENRKVSEDLATALYSRLRNNNQITVNIHLPIEDPTGKKRKIIAQMQSDIVMGPTISQVNQQGYDKAQLYKARISFEIQNVNIYNFIQEKEYLYNIYVVAKLDGNSSKTQQELVWSQEEP